MTEVDELDDFIKSNNRKKRIKMIIFGLICSIPLWMAIYRTYTIMKHNQKIRERRAKRLRLKPWERKELKSTITRLLKGQTEKIVAWNKAMKNLDKMSPSETQCSHQYRAPTHQAASDYLKHGSIDGNYFGNTNYSLYKTTDRIPASDLQYTHKELLRARSKLQAGTANRNTLRSVRKLEGDDEELIVVATTIEPMVTSVIGKVRFRPGSIQGKVYLYSHRLGKVRCVGHVNVQNTSSVQFRYSYNKNNVFGKSTNARYAAQGTLKSQLKVLLMREIVNKLRTPSS